MIRFAYGFTITLVFASAGHAHPGGLDANGGHHDRRNGGYHIHRPSVAPITASPPVAGPTPIPRVTARTEYRTEPRTTARTSARRSDKGTETRPQIPPGWENLSAEERRERLAAAKLRAAKDLLVLGKTEAAVKWLIEIVKEYSETKAASEAKTLLTKLGQNKFTTR